MLINCIAEAAHMCGAHTQRNSRYKYNHSDFAIKNNTFLLNNTHTFYSQSLWCVLHPLVTPLYASVCLDHRNGISVCGLDPSIERFHIQTDFAHWNYTHFITMSMIFKHETWRICMVLYSSS